MVKKHIKNMKDKWDRLVDAAEQGIAPHGQGAFGKHVGIEGSTFLKHEDISVNGVPEWTFQNEWKKRSKETDLAKR